MEEDLSYKRCMDFMATHDINQEHNENFSNYLRCRSCGKMFDSFGDLQKHILIEHMQKGDIP